MNKGEKDNLVGLVTVDKREDLSGYRITFIDTITNGSFLEQGRLIDGNPTFVAATSHSKHGFLRYNHPGAEIPNKYGRIDGRIFVPFTDYDENNSGENTLYSSDKGLDIIRSIGAEIFWLQGRIKPKEKIDEGTESKIFRIDICGADYVIKIPSEEGLEELNKSNYAEIFNRKFHRVNYLNKFGITKKISRALSSINGFRGILTLENPPEEHIASRNFMVEEYKSGTNLENMINTPGKKLLGDDNQDLRWLSKEWFKAFEKEISRIEKLFFFVGYEKDQQRNLRHRHFFGKTDLAFKNWVFSGVDTTTNLPRIFLVDQSPGEASKTPRDIMVEEMLAEETYKGMLSSFYQDTDVNVLRKMQI